MRRRELLQMFAGTCSAACLPSVGATETTAANGCLLGFSTYGAKSMKTEAAIHMLQEIGFDSVELAVWQDWDADPAQMSQTRRQTLRQQLGDSGLVLTSLMEHVPPTDERKQEFALSRLRLAAELAHDLCPRSPPLVQTVLGGGAFEKSKSWLTDRVGKWADLAAEMQVTIAIKPHRGGVVSQPSEAVWLFEQLGKPKNLRMVYDYSHYAFRNLAIDETIEVAIPYTAHVAVKDAVQQSDRVVFQLPGQAGTIDFEKVIGSLYQRGYRGDISCEVSGMVWKRSGYDVRQAAETCYQNVAEAMGEANVPRRGRR